MKRVKVTLQGIPGVPYSQSRKHDAPKLDREGGDDYDVRTCLLHCTVNSDGQVCIPAMALKQAIDTSAYKLGMKIPGRGRATYKGFFASGFFPEADVPIRNGKILKPEDAVVVTISANATGERGGGKRVPRRYPEFTDWIGEAMFTITDDIITKEVFETHVRTAGMVVGIGRFRPEKGGLKGRFRATKFEWEELAIE